MKNSDDKKKHEDEFMSLDNYENRESIAVNAIMKSIGSSSNSRLVKNKTFFANLYENSLFPNYYSFSSADGVGSKLIIASVMNKFDTIGIDLVAMNANDAATLGRIMPDMFMNIISCQDKIQEERITGDIIKGIIIGLDDCDVSQIIKGAPKLVIGKGETASMQDLISGPRFGYGFDITGAINGYMKKSDVPDFDPKPGDVIIGVESSGLHSNGYTSVRYKLLNGKFEPRPEFRKLYTGTHDINESFNDGINNISLGEELLKPTKLYVKLMARVATDFPGTFGVNITGYGLKNFNRIGKNIKYVISDPVKPKPIFEMLQEDGKFSIEQMYEKFNMGMGFAIICKKENAEFILRTAKKMNHEAKIIGHIAKADAKQLKNSTEINVNGKKIVYTGYG